MRISFSHGNALFTCMLLSSNGQSAHQKDMLLIDNHRSLSASPPLASNQQENVLLSADKSTKDIVADICFASIVNSFTIDICPYSHIRKHKKMSKLELAVLASLHSDKERLDYAQEFDVVLGKASSNVDKNQWNLVEDIDHSLLHTQLAALPTTILRKSFTNGTPCKQAQQRIPRTVLLDYYCDPTAKKDQVMTVYETQSCAYHVTVKTNSTCRLSILRPPLPKSWHCLKDDQQEWTQLSVLLSSDNRHFENRGKHALVHSQKKKTTTSSRRNAFASTDQLLSQILNILPGKLIFSPSCTLWFIDSSFLCKFRKKSMICLWMKT